MEYLHSFFYQGATAPVD